MVMGDMPALAKSSYSNTSYGLGNLAAGNSFVGTTSNTAWIDQPVVPALLGVQQGGVPPVRGGPMFQAQQEIKPKPKPKEKKVTRRLVQVFIADPDENVPLENAVLYSGEQKLTDLTDQELFFEIDIKGVLAEHNKKRVNIIDKKVKERTEYLEPVKVRDLKMVVVDVASF